MVHEDIWEDFKEELAKIWMSYRDYDGSLLNTRVHWAKENPRNIQVNGTKENSITFWQQIYQDRMQDFFDVLKKIMFTLKAIERVFKIKLVVFKVLNENFILFVRKF